MPYGAIYIAHNPRDGDSTFKVGKTERVVEQRMRELTSSTTNLGTYTYCAHFVVYDIESAERACHNALRRYRVQDNREFFELPLSRLIQIVSEQVRPYAARDMVPEIERDESASLTQKNAVELLISARDKHGEINRRWDEALASAEQTISHWSSMIQEKVMLAAIDLQAEKTLKWSIPANIELTQIVSRNALLDDKRRWGLAWKCSVTVTSIFSKDPLVLWRSGIRGGIYGSLDLSRAIGQPDVRTVHPEIDKDSQFVKWQELDDGRVGHIELVAHVEDTMPDYGERSIKPLPRITVRATAIQYDNCRYDFVVYNQCEKSYGDPEEALEVFLSLVVENAKVPQYDVRVRQQSGEFDDRGKLEMHLLED